MKSLRKSDFGLFTRAHTEYWYKFIGGNWQTKLPKFCCKAWLLHKGLNVKITFNIEKEITKAICIMLVDKRETQVSGMFKLKYSCTMNVNSNN